MEVTYTVYIYIDDTMVGEGVIKLIDEYEDSGSVQITTRSVDGGVRVDDVETGLMYGRYIDYVTYAYGGSREYTVKVYTYIDNVLLSMVGLEHSDRYGSIVGVQPEEPFTPQPWKPPWYALALPLAMGLGAFLLGRKKEE